MGNSPFPGKHFTLHISLKLAREASHFFLHKDVVADKIIGSNKHT
jgi:hypothetical protein